MTGLQPSRALLGGVLVGIGLVLALLASGRVVGVSGVVGGLLRPRAGDTGWRLAFLIGLLGGGAVLAVFAPGTLTFDLERSLPTLATSGLLVGYGTRLGKGCTSGHGVCGLSRLSPRSMVASAVFIAAGIVTVFLTKRLLGWRS